MGADYSFELIFIETYAPQFIGCNKIFLGSVNRLRSSDLIRQAKGIQPQIPFKQTNRLRSYSQDAKVVNEIFIMCNSG